MHYLKSLGIWTLFSVAIFRTIELFEIEFFTLNLFIPSFLFFCFLIYYLIKEKIFLSYRNFLLSILVISFIFYLFNYIVVRFIRLDYRENELLRNFVLFVLCNIISSIFYYIGLFLKRIFNS